MSSLGVQGIENKQVREADLLIYNIHQKLSESPNSLHIDVHNNPKYIAQGFLHHLGVYGTGDVHVDLLIGWFVPMELFLDVLRTALWS